MNATLSQVILGLLMRTRLACEQCEHCGYMWILGVTTGAHYCYPHLKRTTDAEFQTFDTEAAAEVRS